MKLNHIIILQNKVDLMREEGAEQHYQSILKFIRGTVADGSPIIPISAQLKFNIDAVNEYLVTKIPVPVRDFTAKPHMIVIRSFDVNKPGAEIEELKGGVAGGSILTGVLKLGDEVEIRPGIVTKDEQGKIQAKPIYSRVVSLFAEHNDLKFAVPGGLIGRFIQQCTARSPRLTFFRCRYPRRPHALPCRPSGRFRSRPPRPPPRHLHGARGQLLPSPPPARCQDGRRQAGQGREACEERGAHGQHWQHGNGR